MPDRILILGASARAAAASARRAGLTPFAVDLFADRDTQVLCEHVERCPLADYPRGLFDRARRLPPMPWLYTGGLENYPDLVGGLAAERELWGNSPDVLRRVRDPINLSGWLKRRDEWQFAESAARPGQGRWLRKPLRSGGGRHVRDATESGPDDECYFQRFAVGRPMSAVVATAGNISSPLAIHFQLIGCRWLHASPFAYCGNITQLVAEAEQEPMVFEVGLDLSIRCGVQGVWGFDFIEGPDGARTVVEVNPRYTASVEVHELATGVSLLRRADPPPPATKVVGKATYYAARPLIVPANGPWDESLAHCGDVWVRPDFADIPHPGEVIEPGQPVVTLLADAATEAAVLATLKARAAALDRLFGVPTPEDDSP